MLVLCFTFAAPVTADKNGVASIQGAASCGNWVKFRKEGSWEAIIYKAWIAGYISAFNTQTSDVYSILGSTDLESALLWMDKYCQENPLNDSADGMIVLTNELWPNRKRPEHD